MTVEQWLGKDNLLGIDIWMRKYLSNSVKNIILIILLRNNN